MLMEESLLYLLVTNVITLGQLENQKCWNHLNDELKDLWVFAYHTSSMALRKKGERGQLNMHIIWHYIQSLGFKLLDERQLWINVIFSFTFGHLLRAWKKSLYGMLVCYYYSLLLFLGSHCPSETPNYWTMSLISDIHLWTYSIYHSFALSNIPLLNNNVLLYSLLWMNESEKLRPHWRGTYLLSKGKYSETRAACQRTERHSSANLFKVCLVDVLLLWWGTYVHSSCATVNRPWLCAS